LGNFVIISPETLNTKITVNEVLFALVTLMAYSDARFGRYGLLELGYGAEQFLGRLDTQVNGLV
jgi:hypothetical protein